MVLFPIDLQEKKIYVNYEKNSMSECLENCNSKIDRCPKILKSIHV